jgi:hypothetical protein
MTAAPDTAAVRGVVLAVLIVAMGCGSEPEFAKPAVPARDIPDGVIEYRWCDCTTDGKVRWMFSVKAPNSSRRYHVETTSYVWQWADPDKGFWYRRGVITPKWVPAEDEEPVNVYPESRQVEAPR